MQNYPKISLEQLHQGKKGRIKSPRNTSGGNLTWIIVAWKHKSSNIDKILHQVLEKTIPKKWGSITN
jgi:hypothetical protein